MPRHPHDAHVASKPLPGLLILPLLALGCWLAGGGPVAAARRFGLALAALLVACAAAYPYLLLRFQDFWDFLPQDDGVFRPTNVGKVRILGVEAGIRSDFGYGFTGDLNYTFTDAIYTEFDANPDVITECDPDFFGAFWVVGATDDGDSVTILLPPDGDPNFEDPPSVRVKVNNGGPDFTADPSIVETGDYSTVISVGDTQIDSFTVDGNSASGTATFVDEQAIFIALGGTGADPEPVEGSFEVTCEAG